MNWRNILKENRLIKLRKLLDDSMKDKKFVDFYMDNLGLTEKNADLEKTIDEYLNYAIEDMKIMAEGESDKKIIQFTTNYIKKLNELGKYFEKRD